MRHCAVYFLLCFVLTGSAFAEVRENIEYKYYEIKAEAGRPLRPQIFAATPIKTGEELFGGNTNWNIKWDTQVESDSNGACHITGVSTILNVVISLPKLNGGDDLQKTNFDRFFITLREHELNHYKISSEAAQEIDSNLKDLPPIYHCKELKDLANKIAYGTLDFFNKKQRQYDSDTKHGHKEGAWVH
jgi:predicted secreted Zn-dependent protease